MKFSTREDIDAPIDAVYQQVSDFDAFERQALRRGIDITRDETMPLDQPGLSWKASFDWRSRKYDLDAELESIVPGRGYAIASHTAGVNGTALVELVALSKTRTRLLVSLDLKPTTLSSRLLIQSLKLAKGSLTTRFKSRVAQFASSVADRA